MHTLHAPPLIRLSSKLVLLRPSAVQHKHSFMATSDPPPQPFNAVDSFHHRHCHHQWFHHYHQHLCHHQCHWFHHHQIHHHPLFTVSPHWFPIPSLHFPNYHFHVNPPFAPLHIPLLPESNIDVSKPNNGALDLAGAEIKESGVAEETQLLEEGFEEEVEEDDGEAVFVMTDEWVEFFAKSEAKRKLEKKLAKKNKKKGIE